MRRTGMAGARLAPGAGGEGVVVEAEPGHDPKPPGEAERRGDGGGRGPPPDKPHFFSVRRHALRAPSREGPADAPAAYIGFTVRSQSLGKAELMGVYGR